MSRISLVISDVDGTLLTPDKILTQQAVDAVARLRAAGIGFTVVSSRPIIGMGFLVEPLGLTLPIGAFNGSSIVDPTLHPIEQHAIPMEAAKRSLDFLQQIGIDSWLFTGDSWLIRNLEGSYVAHERHAIRAEPTVIDSFAPYLSSACKIVGACADAERLQHCERTLQSMLGAEATAIRSQSYYLDVTPPGYNKGTFVRALARHTHTPLGSIATLGDMQNDLAMFEVSGISFAMGNASDSVKTRASRVTTSNTEEGFAMAIDAILALNQQAWLG